MYEETGIVVFLKKKKKGKKKTHNTGKKKVKLFPSFKLYRIKGTVYIMGLTSWADFVNCYFFFLYYPSSLSLSFTFSFLLHQMQRKENVKLFSKEKERRIIFYFSTLKCILCNNMSARRLGNKSV